MERKTALVTGACVNTGVAIVEKFASEGYNVVFTGRSKEKVSAAQADYRKKFPLVKIDGYVLDSVDDCGNVLEKEVDDFFAMLDEKGVFVECVVLNAADQGLNQKIF